MKRGINIVFLLMIILSLNLVLANFTLGDNTNIEANYGPKGILTGIINISFEDQPADSIITSNFQSSDITLLNFFRANAVTPECNTPDCSSRYVSRSGDSRKSFSLNRGEEKTISFLITSGSEIQSIGSQSVKSFNLDISATNQPSCLNPLEIDVLDDGIIEWRSDRFSTDYSCVVGSGYGCFDPFTTLDVAPISYNDPYCEKIGLTPSGKFALGAWVKQNSDATPDWYDGLLKMYLYDLGGDIPEGCTGSCVCELPEPSINGGEVNCIIDFKNEKIRDYYVCIKGEDTGITGYVTNREDINACGFFALPGQEVENHDYHIFAKAARYDNIGVLIFNQEEYARQVDGGNLANEIFDKYSSGDWEDCSRGCSIPIKFKAIEDIDIDVSDPNLDYTSAGGPSSTSLIYDTSIESAEITTDYKSLEISHANIIVPEDLGEYTLELKLNDDNILEQEVFVLNIPVIKEIFPSSTAALVPTTFVVSLEGSQANLTFVWDFGDNNTVTTTTNRLEHTYNNINTGGYSLKVSVSNILGETSKTFNIIVDAPKDAIDKTLKLYKEDLSNLRLQINNLPEFIRKGVEKEVDIDELGNALKKQEDANRDAILPEEFINIMKRLLQLDVPKNIGRSQVIKKTTLIQSENQLNLNILDSLQAGSLDESKEDIYNAINAWLRENLEVSIESETYTFFFRNRENKDLFSYMKVDLLPRINLDEIFFVINGIYIT